MSLPHTYNPVFTTSGTPPPASGDEKITLPYAGVKVGSVTNSVEVDITFSNNGNLTFSGLNTPDPLPWGTLGATRIDTAGWYETKTSTLTASDWEIRFSWSPASFQSVVTSPSMSQNTWYSLGTTRTVTFGHSETTSFQRINSGTLTTEIRKASGQSGVAACEKTFTVVTTINEL